METTMRRRDWLKSIVALAVVPLIGVRKAVAATETATEALPAVAPTPPAAETVAEPVRRQNWSRESIWINDDPSDGAMAFGGPKDGEVLPGTVARCRCYPYVRCDAVPNMEWHIDERLYEFHQYYRERIVLSTPNVRIFLDVWCYAGTGVTATPESKAAALKWAHENYGRLIVDSYLSADEIRAKIRSLA
jgi:hypothetical protein